MLSYLTMKWWNELRTMAKDWTMIDYVARPIVGLLLLIGCIPIVVALIAIYGPTICVMMRAIKAETVCDWLFGGP